MHKIFTAQAAAGTFYGLKTGSTDTVTFHVYGTWDGATVTVQVSNDSGANWVAFVPDGTPLVFTADTQVIAEIGPGQRLRFVVTVGTSVLNLYAGGDLTQKIESATA